MNWPQKCVFFYDAINGSNSPRKPTCHINETFALLLLVHQKLLPRKKVYSILQSVLMIEPRMPSTIAKIDPFSKKIL